MEYSLIKYSCHYCVNCNYFGIGSTVQLSNQSFPHATCSNTKSLQ